MATKKTKGKAPPAKTADAGAPPSITPPAKRRRMRRLHVRADIGHGGSLTVRHMSDGATCVHLRAVAFDASTFDDDAPKWIQLAKPGHFRGHRAGPFTLDARVFGELVRNFKANPQGRVQVDFEHASEMTPTQGSIPTQGAPAQGWILELAQRDDGNLYALVDWLEPARTYIREGKYTAISPAIVFAATDGTTGANIGANLTSAALTNNPFLKGMRPLTASASSAEGDDGEPVETTVAVNDDTGAIVYRAGPVVHVLRGAMCYSAGDYMPRIHAALGTHALATPGEMSSRLESLRAMLDTAGGDHTKSVGGVSLASHLTPLRDLAGLPANATWPEVIEVIEDLIDAAMDQHIEEMHGGADGAAMTDDEEEDATTMSQTTPPDSAAVLAVKDAEIATLTARVAKAEAENIKIRSDLDARLMSDREREVDEAIAVHRLDKGKRAALLSILAASPEGFRDVYPPVDAEKRRLLTDTNAAKRDDSAPAGSPAAALTLSQLTAKIETDEKVSFDVAQEKAIKLMSEAPIGPGAILG